VSRNVVKLLALLGGVVLVQAFLYGPSLAGRKILLPLDILTMPDVYLPSQPGQEQFSRSARLGDLIYLLEPARRFAVAELRTGRLPMWCPGYFAGAPFIWPKFSPFLALQCCTESPVVLAWSQLLMAIVAALGAYLFFRRVLAVSFWPAAICGWCYPLTGFLVLWQGYPTGLAVYWLPWILLAVDKTVRGTGRVTPLRLGVATCLVLVSGHLDVAGQVLLVSGLYGLWRLLETHRNRWFRCQARRAVLGLASGWTLGFLLAAPYLLPAVEYSQTGARMARRWAGFEERRPVGLEALPQMLLPSMYGAGTGNSLRCKADSQLESSAAAYTGVVATLLAAPLAWCSRRHRSVNVFWACLGFFGVSWCLNVPGIVHLLRLPGLNMMSHNRLAFATSFAILALSATGLEVIWQGPVRRRLWFWAPATLLAGLCLWCLYRTQFAGEPFETKLAQLVLDGKRLDWVRDLDGVRQVQAWAAEKYAIAAAWCGIGVAAWLLLWARPALRPRLFVALALTLVGELFLFALGRVVQCDPALYYPPLPVLAQVAKSVPGRAIGNSCLLPNLAVMCGLRDVRGYDSVDPARLVDLMEIARDPQYEPADYAATQYLVPKKALTHDGELRLPPVLDMLAVRYVIFRGAPDPQTHPAFRGEDYWVLVNSNALPRAFVPQRVESVPNSAARLAQLASPAFEPRKVAYVESPVNLPVSCRGTADIVAEVPTRITISVRMATPGLVVLADLWDKGWRAWLDGREVPILRANHAIRGVVVPAGESKLEFRYAPSSFAWGLRLSGLALLVILGWSGVAHWKSKARG
jgi:hypothetical protein